MVPIFGLKINGGVEPLKKGILIGKKASIGVDDWLTFRERSEGWFGGSEVSKFLPLEKRQLIEDSKQTNFGKWVVLLLYGEIWYIESMNQVAINGNSVPFHPTCHESFCCSGRKPSGAFKDNVQSHLMVPGRRLLQTCTSDGYTRAWANE